MSKISKTYVWRWKDENGKDCGWNWTNAYTKAEARKLAKAMESPARDFDYEVYADATLTTTKTLTERNTGMFVNFDTFKRVNNEQFHSLWKASYMD